jgi:hypothetical protein
MNSLRPNFTAMNQAQLNSCGVSTVDPGCEDSTEAGRALPVLRRPSMGRGHGMSFTGARSLQARYSETRMGVATAWRRGPIKSPLGQHSARRRRAHCYFGSLSVAPFAVSTTSPAPLSRLTYCGTNCARATGVLEHGTLSMKAPGKCAAFDGESTYRKTPS